MKRYNNIHVEDFYECEEGQWIRSADIEGIVGDNLRLMYYNRNIGEENARLKELNREVTKELTNLLFGVELSPPAQDRIDKIFDLLARGE